MFLVRIIIFITLLFSLSASASSNFKTHKRNGGPDIVVQQQFHTLANGPIPTGETPASISCVYGFTPYVPGCPINGTTQVPNGGAGMIIAVTEGGHDPNAQTELNTFSSQFHLPPLALCSPGAVPCFQTVIGTQDGVQAPTLSCTNPPSEDCDALAEHVLDIEWAHAMAPNASIYMVEAYSFDPAYIYYAVDKASSLLQSTGGIISSSWSFNEMPGEQALDSHFQTPGIIYIASSGDYLAPSRYPASSPYVISAGGTGFVRDGAGNFVQEVSWYNPNIPPGVHLSGSSGGPSVYEPRPTFQNSVSKVVGSARGTPDISFFAEISTGVDIYLIENGVGKWRLSGGTSLASPSLAGVIATAHSGATSTAQELAYIYGNAQKNYHSYWNDIIVGNNGFPTLPGYDFVTGLGSPKGYQGK